MRRIALLVVIALSVACSRYETRTADGLTLRTDKTTGKTEVLTRAPDGALRWRPVEEPKARTANAQCDEIRARWSSPRVRDAELKVAGCI
jgi:hypothetical protein